jgi:hypothetical protein
MSTPIRRNPEIAETPASAPALESLVSGVSWPAVIAGAFVTAAIGLTLMALGAGMGLSAISPWPRAGWAATRVAPGAIIWVLITQLLSCALGGYVAGRLRTKWASVHNHEVYFRDTAHGLLVWAVAVVMTVVFFSSLAASLAGEASAAAATRADPSDYYVDSLLRGPHPSGEIVNDQPLRNEVRVILAKALRDPEVSGADRAYLASLVVSRTGIGETEAARRVDETIAAARQAVNTARKAVAHSLYWLVVALLVGAFSASLTAIAGGRRRDFVWAT